MSFQDDLAVWSPRECLNESDSQQWALNADGSITITLPDVIAWNLADELLKWEQHGSSWMEREDCQNWKRSAIARENRRETIVYANLLESIRSLLGHRETRALMEHVKANK